MSTKIPNYIIKNNRLHGYIRNLDNLFDVAKKIENEELLGYFSKYLCLQVSSLVEIFFKTCIERYVKSTSPTPIRNYINKMFRTFTNINTLKVSNVLESFSQDWKDIFEKTITDEQKSSLDTIINNRNNIAHGNQSNISYNEMKKHYENIKIIIEIIDNIIK